MKILGLKSPRKYIPQIYLRATAWVQPYSSRCGQESVCSLPVRTFACKDHVCASALSHSSVIDTLEHCRSFPLRRHTCLLHLRWARRSCGLCISRSLNLATQNQGQMSGQGSPRQRRTIKPAYVSGENVPAFSFWSRESRVADFVISDRVIGDLKRRNG